jgi:hypothetical protein
MMSVQSPFISRRHAAHSILAGLMAVLNCASIWASTLSPGAEVVDCRSALRAGPHSCEPTANEIIREGASTAEAPASDPVHGTSEAQVDAFLATYGKPPREAVRALLDPSDENIRALLRNQERTIAVASFVAARMTQMQAERKGVAGDSSNIIELPSAMNTRLTLAARIGDPSIVNATMAVERLARELPALNVRIELHGSASGEWMREYVGHIDPAVQVGRVAESDVDGSLPQVRLEDLRTGSWRAWDAAEATISNLRQMLIAFCAQRATVLGDANRHSGGASAATANP